MKNISYTALFIAMLFVANATATRDPFHEKKSDIELRDRASELMDKAKNYISGWNDKVVVPKMKEMMQVLKRSVEKVTEVGVVDKARDFIPDWNRAGYSNLPKLFKSLDKNELVVPKKENDDTYDIYEIYFWIDDKFKK
jgi:hypothetical protein